MADTRPKRTAAAKAESENKRIALAAMKPMEAQDLQTQDVVERERPAPHKRYSVQPEAAASPNQTPNRSSIADVPAVGMGRSVQVQVVIPQRSSTNCTSSAPTRSRSQSVPPAGTFKQPSPPQPNTAPSRPPVQNLSMPGTFQRPTLPPAKAPGPNPQTQSNNAPRNSQQPTPLTNAPKPNPSHPNPQVQRQRQHSAGPGPVPGMPKPTLIEQVKSANRGVRQQQQLQQALNGSTISSPALVHTQATNSIAIGFHEAGPVHRALTKIAEGKVTSQAPPTDVIAAQRLGRELSPEEMRRLVGLARVGSEQHLQQGLQAPRMGDSQSVSGQQLQHGFQVQRTGTPQPVPVRQLQQGFQRQHPSTPQPNSGQQPQHGRQIQRAGMPQPGPRQQYAPNQPPRPRHHSFPPGRPAGHPSASPPKPNQQSRAANGPAPVDTNLPRPSLVVPGGSVHPTSGTRTDPANSAFLPPRPGQQSRAANGQVMVPTGHPRASSEAPAQYMQPPLRRRSNSANPAVPSSRNPDISDYRLPMLPPREPNGAPSMGGKPHFDYPRPPELPLANKNGARPRIKINFNPNATPRDGQPEGSDTTLSPSPLKVPRLNFDSDATLSPSPLKVPRLKLGHVIPPAPLFNKAHAPTEAISSGAKPVSTKQVLSSQEPLIRQQNLDFDYKPVPQQDETPVGFDQEVDFRSLSGNTPVVLPRGPNPIQASFLHPQEDGEETDQPEQNVPAQRQPHSPFSDDLMARIQLRSDALERMQDRTHEDDEELRLSTALTKTLMTLKLGRALDKSKAQEESPLGRHSSKVIPGCLAVTQLPAAIEMPIRNRPQTLHESMTGNDDNACVFCNYEASFGIADSRVWLPVEASPGFCNECHEDTQEVFKMWESSHKLTHGLTPEKKEKYRALLENSTTTPLKELGNTTDFKMQQKVEMSKPRRQNAILNASRPCMRDGRKDRRKQRKEYNLATSVRNLPRGGKLPTRRAISGDVTKRNSLAADVQKAVSEGHRVNQQMSNPVRNMPPTPSPLGIPVPTFLNPNPSQAAHTGWVNGAPSALPTMSGSIAAPGHSTSRARDVHGRVITPNSAAFMGLLELAAPPGSAISSTATSSGTGTPNSSGTAVPSPTLSNSSIPGHPTTAPRPTSTSAQPTGPSGVPRYFNSGPPGSFLSPPPFNNGPTFCRGCPWRLIDFTKAKICTTCRDCKFLICTHSYHTDFNVLATTPGILDGEHKGHGLGRVTRDGIFITDGRYSNCMICTGQATHGCNDCPLRLCGECVVRLTKMCKGKISELLNFYNQGRDHIRNDAFLLRNDNKGF
ncbi:hypothetical protein ACEPPN_017644 [Leptodophora sp. 'Broadleaf-Isolate-01']